jgi:hypothetical protein
MISAIRRFDASAPVRVTAIHSTRLGPLVREPYRTDIMLPAEA